MTNPKNTNKIAAYIGSLIGCLGWVIGFFFIALSSGTLNSFLKPLIIGALSSVSFFLIIAIMMEFCYAMNIIQKDRPIFMLILGGAILFAIGNMSILCTHLFAPIIDRTPNLAQQLNNMGSVYRVDDIISAFLLFSGTIFLSFAFMKICKKSNSQ